MAKYRKKYLETPKYQREMQRLQAGAIPERTAISQIGEQKLGEIFAEREMAKDIQLKQLGLTKEVREESLAQGRLRLGLAADQLQFTKSQAKKSERIAKWGMMVSAAFGIRGFMQKRKLQRKYEQFLDFLKTQRSRIKGE